MINEREVKEMYHMLGIGCIVAEIAGIAVIKFMLRKELNKIDGFHGIVKGKREDYSNIIAKL